MVESLTCEEKQQLLGAYQYVTENYSAALTALQRKMGILSKPEYDALYRMIEALCHDSMLAREKYQAHVRGHRC
jgi:hypothetical protein